MHRALPEPSLCAVRGLRGFAASRTAGLRPARPHQPGIHPAAPENPSRSEPGTTGWWQRPWRQCRSGADRAGGWNREATQAPVEERLPRASGSSGAEAHPGAGGSTGNGTRQLLADVPATVPAGSNVLVLGTAARSRGSGRAAEALGWVMQLGGGETPSPPPAPPVSRAGRAAPKSRVCVAPAAGRNHQRPLRVHLRPAEHHGVTHSENGAPRVPTQPPHLPAQRRRAPPAAEPGTGSGRGQTSPERDLRRPRAEGAATEPPSGSGRDYWPAVLTAPRIEPILCGYWVIGRHAAYRVQSASPPSSSLACTPANRTATRLIAMFLRLLCTTASHRVAIIALSPRSLPKSRPLRALVSPPMRGCRSLKDGSAFLSA